MGTIFVWGFLSIFLGVPGYVIYALGLALGGLASSATMRLLLSWTKEKAIPLAPTTTSVGIK